MKHWLSLWIPRQDLPDNLQNSLRRDAKRIGRDLREPAKPLIQPLPKRIVQKTHLGELLRIRIGPPIVVKATDLREDVAGVHPAAGFQRFPMDDFELPPAR